MAENTFRPKKDEKIGGKEQTPSMIGKIGKWLTGQKDEAPKSPDPVPAKDTAQRNDSGGRAESRPARSKRPRPRKRPGGKPGSPRGGQQRKTSGSGGGGAKPSPPRSSPPKKEVPPSSGENKDVPCKLLINSDEPEECRIALIENGRVEAFYVDTVLHTKTKGNIYKARVVAVEPSLQAAFVDMGGEKNGFLPFGDIHPEYFHGKVSENAHWKDLDIQKIIRKGDEVLVQIVKEAVGNKGANLTTYISLPGRYLVLMPGSDSAGISRKIESESQRKKLRSLVESLTLPEGIGYIVRTASNEITKSAISQDLKYLLNLWEEIRERGRKMATASLIYKEQDIIARFLRDHYTSNIKEIMVDNEEGHEKVLKFLKLIPARQKKAAARLYSGSQPIFNHYQVEKQIEQIYKPTVSLPSGGSIVINPTEALVAIDVNSGRTSKDKNFEQSIFLANMEAAEELARQLRLRDLGGLIVVDFIDMRPAANIREVEKKVKASMKRDKAKVDISRISRFGLMQISRQKLASPIQMGSYNVCEHCQGRGLVRSVETLSLYYLRRIQTGITRKKNVLRVDCRLPIAVAQYLQNKKRSELLELENKYEVAIDITADPSMLPTDNTLEFVKN
ncbi:MAG: Rne/Rng family ribonuclease [Thermodesulfobacteriota bacterium]